MNLFRIARDRESSGPDTTGISPREGAQLSRRTNRHARRRAFYSLGGRVIARISSTIAAAHCSVPAPSHSAISAHWQDLPGSPVSIARPKSLNGQGARRIRIIGGLSWRP